MVSISNKNLNYHYIFHILVCCLLFSFFRKKSTEAVPLDLPLLKPLWTMYTSISHPRESGYNVITEPISRALTEIFYVAECLAEVGVTLLLILYQY